MKIELKRNDVRKNFEVRDRLQTLVESNYNNRKYCEEVFGMFDIAFDEDYSDVVKFMGAKKGVLKTNYPVLAKIVRVFIGENLEFYSWERLSYDVAYYDIDLSCTYTLPEVEVLIKTGKVILLKTHKEIYCDKLYVEEVYSKEVDKFLPTLEKYDFTDVDKNGIDNNQLVFGMVRTSFDYEEARSELSKLEEAISLSNIENVSQDEKIKLKNKSIWTKK